MQYSVYELDRIIDSCPGYDELYRHLLGLLKDEKRKTQLKQVLYDGGIGNYSLSSKITSHDNPTTEGRRRISMAYLLVRNPEVFDFLVENNINLFHGTNINALPSILEYGMNSLKESNRLGIYVSTGEKWSRMSDKRDYVSFTDVVEVAERYAGISPIEEEKDSFEIIIGTTKEDIESERVCRVPSDVQEIGIRKNFPTEKIRVIAVPSDKVDVVKKMVGDKNIPVVGIDFLREKFFYQEDWGPIQIYEGAYQKIKEKVFREEEIKELASTRFLTRIQKMMEKLSSWRKKEEDSNDRKINESVTRR